MIEVLYDDSGKVYEIRSITEGKMTRGQFDGFGRKFTVKSEKKSYVPVCTLGYWRNNKPFGASISYESDAKGNTSILEQGVYDGKMESELNITDFKINSFPKRGIEEEVAKKEAARLRAEALLVKT